MATAASTVGRSHHGRGVTGSRLPGRRHTHKDPSLRAAQPAPDSPAPVPEPFQPSRRQREAQACRPAEARPHPGGSPVGAVLQRLPESVCSLGRGGGAQAVLSPTPRVPGTLSQPRVCWWDSRTHARCPDPTPEGTWEDP